MLIKTQTIHIVGMVKKGDDPINIAYYSGIAFVWEVAVMGA